MDESTDKILARELGKIGQTGGTGGRRGASFAARFLPTQTFSTTLRLGAEPATVLRAALSILGSMGEVSNEPDEVSGPACLTALVGSGFLGMNPALLKIVVKPAGEKTSDVSIAAAAKEGLIKQHTAEKAVARLKDELLRIRW